MGSVVSALGPAEDDVRDVLEAASLASSRHNAQPWRFTLHPDRIELHGDPGRLLETAAPEWRSGWSAPRSWSGPGRTWSATARTGNGCGTWCCGRTGRSSPIPAKARAGWNPRSRTRGRCKTSPRRTTDRRAGHLRRRALLVLRRPAG